MSVAKVETLYDRDFALWIDETVKQLKSGNFSEIDLANLIDEVESLGLSAIFRYMSIALSVS